MKNYSFLIIIVFFLFSCGEKKSTDEIVKEIKSNSSLKEVETITMCGDIVYNLEDDEIKHFKIDYYMGDGGAEFDCYFYNNELIYSEYYSFYEGPVMNDDGTYSEGGETIGDKYIYYFENEKLQKCIKNGEEITEFNPDAPDYDPEPEKLIKFAANVKDEMNNEDSEILCEQWF